MCAHLTEKFAHAHLLSGAQVAPLLRWPIPVPKSCNQFTYTTLTSVYKMRSWSGVQISPGPQESGPPFHCL